MPSGRAEWIAMRTSDTLGALFNAEGYRAVDDG